MQKPTIGRIVYYHALDDGYYFPEDVLPAIITQVNEDDTVNLQVFPNRKLTLQFRADVTNDDTRSASYWAWPPREGA